MEWGEMPAFISQVSSNGFLPHTQFAGNKYIKIHKQVHYYKQLFYKYGTC